MLRRLIIGCIAFALSTPLTHAHPGNTAADGCHYCRTNCSKWGVRQDERHCHAAKVKESAGKTTSVKKPPAKVPVSLKKKALKKE